MTTQPGTPPAGASPFRFFDGQFAANPFPMLAQMRAMGAIVEVPLPYSDGTHKAWMVTRMEEAVQVLKDRLCWLLRTSVHKTAELRQYNRSHLPSCLHEKTHKSGNSRRGKLMLNAYTYTSLINQVEKQHVLLVSG
jgi:hypothetical protein